MLSLSLIFALDLFSLLLQKLRKCHPYTDIIRVNTPATMGTRSGNRTRGHPQQPLPQPHHYRQDAPYKTQALLAIAEWTKTPTQFQNRQVSCKNTTHPLRNQMDQPIMNSLHLRIHHYGSTLQWLPKVSLLPSIHHRMYKLQGPRAQKRKLSNGHGRQLFAQ